MAYSKNMFTKTCIAADKKRKYIKKLKWRQKNVKIQAKQRPLYV